MTPPPKTPTKGTVEPAPPAPKMLVEAVKTVTSDLSLKADLFGEFVPGSSEFIWAWQSMERRLKALPNPLDDDLARDLGIDLYDKDMGHDAQIHSTLSIFVMAILAEDGQIVPPDHIKPDSPEFQQVLVYCEFLRAVLRNLRRPFKAILYELIMGMLKLGHKAAELIFDTQVLDPTIGPQIVLKNLKVKKNSKYTWVVDPFLNEIGILPLRRGMPVPSDVTEIVDQVIPRVKFLIFVNDPRDEDHNGTSHLRSVYGPWWFNQQTVPEHLSYMARFAQPSLYETLGPQVPLTVDVKDPVTQAVISRSDTIKANNVELAKMKNGAVKTAPYGSTLQAVQAQGEGKVFFDTYEYNNKMIAKGILFQTLSTEEAKTMARAASTTHQDIFGIAISFFRDLIEHGTTFDLFHILIELNYGAEAVRNCPVYRLGDIQAHDIPTLMRAIAAFISSGGVHWSQLRGVYRMLNMPEPDADVDLSEMLKTPPKTPVPVADPNADIEKQNDNQNDGEVPPRPL